jgi:hypothetical protein
MENIEKEFTPEESLQLIGQIISKTRRNFKLASVYFILWGWIMVIASLACFSLVEYMLGRHQYTYINLGAWLAWIIPIFAGILIDMAYLRPKYVKVEKAKTQIGKIIKILWYANAIAIMIGCFVSYKMHFYPSPLILLIIGISTFVTGYIINYRPVIIGGIIFWLASILSVFIAPDYQLILFAISIFSGYLVPGYMLKYSKE